LKERLRHFLDNSPTAFHATEQLMQFLSSSGYKVLDERLSWDLIPGGKYLVQRNKSSLLAFEMGMGSPTDHGFRIAAAHTDSPHLKIKNLSGKVWKGLLTLGVEIYGGPILSTWLDRDLGLAGKVLLKTSRGIEEQLINPEGVQATIPNLPIHLNREVNKGVELNPQVDLRAVFPGLNTGEFQENTNVIPGEEILSLLLKDHLPAGAAVIDADLFLYPKEKAQFFPGTLETISSARLDNLLGCHAVAEGLEASPSSPSTKIAVFFDHEEIGSLTPQGAQGSFLGDVLGRIMGLGPQPNTEDLYRAKANSLILSVDGAHALHPNHEEKFDPYYAPVFGGGVVIKYNAGQKYATNAASSSWFQDLCSKKGIVSQRLMNRSDIPTGSTVGPFLSSNLGIPAVDIGTPMWAMHSTRETASFIDQKAAVNAVLEFYKEEKI
jgi:aspartyl aminopeptidase